MHPHNRQGASIVLNVLRQIVTLLMSDSFSVIVFVHQINEYNKLAFNQNLNTTGQFFKVLLESDGSCQNIKEHDRSPVVFCWHYGSKID